MYYIPNPSVRKGAEKEENGGFLYEKSKLSSKKVKLYSKLTLEFSKLLK